MGDNLTVYVVHEYNGGFAHNKCNTIGVFFDKDKATQVMNKRFELVDMNSKYKNIVRMSSRICAGEYYEICVTPYVVQ